MSFTAIFPSIGYGSCQPDNFILISKVIEGGSAMDYIENFIVV
jgi:hypothetical protein